MTNTDTQFSARFPEIGGIGAFVANQSSLPYYAPTTSVLNTGMMGDIGRATIYGPDTQDNWFARFMRSPLTRGDAAMTAKFNDVMSRAYDPEAPDEDLFNGSVPGMLSVVAKKNLSRQIAVEVNDYYLRQMAQTDEMIGDVMASIMAVSNACYLDDMWVASKAYFSGSTFGAKTDQAKVMTNDVDDAGFGDELIEALWDFSQVKFGYKSTAYNANGQNTRASRVAVALKRDVEYPAFKKLLSETFNPDYLRIEIDGDIGYVDDFATPAGKPVQSGELIGIVADVRAFDITPMPETLTTEAFRNPARKSTAYFTTYEYAFQVNTMFDIGYIYAPAPPA